MKKKSNKKYLFKVLIAATKVLCKKNDKVNGRKKGGGRDWDKKWSQEQRFWRIEKIGVKKQDEEHFPLLV